MMKRTGVQRLGPDDPQPLQQSPGVNVNIQQASASSMHTLAHSAQPQLLGATTMLSVSGVGNVNVGAVNVGGVNVGVSGVNVGSFRSARAPAPVINYLKPGTVQYATKQPQITIPPRHKPLGSQSPGPSPSPIPAPLATPPPAQFQRLKVEDALSYLDQVKFKFNTQPQVYNDFLDIMKEFKSQTIDTPGVITRVSTLFKGHPELIVGFNTFLPPGYKIEVQSNGQVSVSMPSPTAMGAGGVLLGVHHASPQPQLVHLLPVTQSVGGAIVHNLSTHAPHPTPHVPPHVPSHAPPHGSPHVPPHGAPHGQPHAPANTLHHISQAHQQIEAAASAANDQHHHHNAAGGGQGGGAAAGQPVEFNHAIEYVNKIKSRFSRQPDKYKRFLEILHAYQRGHRDMKQPQAKQQTEQEVYSQVAKLFENQDDLLAEFGQFLPDAKTVAAKHHYPPPHAPISPPPHQMESDPERYSAPPPSPPPAPAHAPHPTVQKHVTPPSAPPTLHLKRSPSFGSANQMQSSGAPPAKKPRPPQLVGARDVSYAEAAKYGTMQEYSYFDKVRKALKSQEVYENFLRCLLLFTNEIISSSELVAVTAPFLRRQPELQRWLAHFVAPSRGTSDRNVSGCDYDLGSTLPNYDKERGEGKSRYEPLAAPAAQLRFDRPQGDAAMDIDLSTCKRLGTSYCALPRGSAEAASRRCSGRTALCKEVLNDTWVSFPTWSEDSTFVTSRKTQYEEYIYRCEDERFELDVVIETNASTIRVLEGVAKRLSRLPAEEAARLRLDDCLGGHSPTVHQRALRRIYGDKVAVDIIAGLKKNPAVAVPVVLRRLKAKEEEWREAQKGFNKQWREQNEKYYLKSLDHQGINFKQNDLKALRSKSLFNEVESAYAARKPGPHVVQDYGVRTRQEAIKIVRDASELLIHHARRQTAIQKAEKRRIKQLLRQFLPDLFRHPRLPQSDDEKDDDDKEDIPSPESASEDVGMEDKNETTKDKENSSESDNASEKSTKRNKNNKENTPKNNNNTDSKDPGVVASVKRSGSLDEPKVEVKDEPEDDYRDHPPNESRFVCTSSWYLFLRLHGVLCSRLAAAAAAAKDLKATTAPTSCAAMALRLKPTNLPPEASSPAEYYNTLLELVRGVLDGNTEPSAYEDAAREMLGIKAYPAYTLDKLVSHAVRQLQHCVSEPWSVRAMELARGGRGGACYVRRALRYLRQHHTAFLVKIYGGDGCRVTFELVEGASEREGRASPHQDAARLSPSEQSRPPTNGETVSRIAAWSLYAERYVRPSMSPTRNKPVFLLRNARRRGGRCNENSAESIAPSEPTLHARRKPKILDRSECTIASRLRLLAARPHCLYRRGALQAARSTLPALQASRKGKFRAWLRRQGTEKT